MVRTVKARHITESSKDTYRTAQNFLQDFCVAFQFEPLALEEEELCMLVLHFVFTHTVHSARSFLSGIQSLWTSAGAGPLPRGPGFLQFLRGLMRLFSPSDEVVRTRALTMDDVTRIMGELDITVADDACFGLELLMGFFLAFRMEDHGKIRFGDVRLRSNGDVETLIAPGKSVRRFRRAAIAAKPGILNVQTWLQAHAAHLPPGARGANQPLFTMLTASGGTQPVSSESIAQLKAKVRSTLGVDPTMFSGYSLRRGGVTEMLAVGVPVAIIKAHVGWAPDSNAHCTYYDNSGQLQMRIATQAMGGARR
jgi:hypothetical protein